MYIIEFSFSCLIFDPLAVHVRSFAIGEVVKVAVVFLIHPINDGNGVVSVLRIKRVQLIHNFAANPYRTENSKVKFIIYTSQPI